VRRWRSHSIVAARRRRARAPTALDWAVQRHAEVSIWDARKACALRVQPRRRGEAHAPPDSGPHNTPKRASRTGEKRMCCLFRRTN
jgi:hypothetical protein